jgi:hypothetical protein
MPPKGIMSRLSTSPSEKILEKSPGPNQRDDKAIEGLVDLEVNGATHRY